MYNRYDKYKYARYLYLTIMRTMIASIGVFHSLAMSLSSKFSISHPLQNIMSPNMSRPELLKLGALDILITTQRPALYCQTLPTMWLASSPVKL